MATHCEHAPTQALNRDAVQAALAKAEARCVAKGQRWTPPRRRVMELLLEAGGPVKAYDLMPAYAEGQVAKPATIYRALEFLEALGLVHRIASLNAYVGCVHDSQAHGAAFLICDCCGSAEEFEPNFDQAVGAAATRRAFTIASMLVEVRGRCGRCSAVQ